jgi:hypothetical protein
MAYIRLLGSGFPSNTTLFFYFLQIYNLLYKLSNKQICYKKTLVRSNHPMMILLCMVYLYVWYILFSNRYMFGLMTIFRRMMVIKMVIRPKHVAVTK